MSPSFNPPLLIRNGHAQTILTSLWPRKLITRLRAYSLIKNEKELILDCGGDVRLLGHYSAAESGTRGLVTLIHGWEGSSYSSYILSAAQQLYSAGFSVFRLNLRDHGNSHHLNPEPFNSSRLAEVQNAVIEINTMFPHQKGYLVGFSLGGNFALRIATRSVREKTPLDRIVAISPLINPLTTTENMEKNQKVYHDYFVKKWKRSLKKKMAIFPQMDETDSLTRLKGLREMHDYFVPRHTDSKTTPEYFGTYRLKPEDFLSLSVPTNIINAVDDPITRISELVDIEKAEIPMLDIEKVAYGGHCGFLQDLRLNCWIDEQLVNIFS